MSAGQRQRLAIDVGVPALFVVLWSTGFIGARLGMPHADPMTFLAVRFALVAGLLTVFSLAVRAPWPRGGREIFHIVVAGLLVHGLYLGGVFASIDHGVETGVSALIVGLQPLLVAALALPFLGERLSWRQWLGLLLGLAGVGLVVAQKLEIGLGTPVGMALSVLALFGLTFGTLYQKRFCSHMDLRTGNAVQMSAACIATGAIAWAFEAGRIDWTGSFVFAMVWLVFVLSLGAFSLLYFMIRRGAAVRVSSLFYLVPPVTALFGWLLFGETFGPLAMAGMALAVIGVGLVIFAPQAADHG
jgi:drug/metabolite transporter (DMT)-like permease